MSPAPVEPRVDLELVPILHHDMVAVNAVARAKTYSLVMKTHAQVKKFWLTLTYLNRGFLPVSSLKIPHIINLRKFLIANGNTH